MTSDPYIKGHVWIAGNHFIDGVPARYFDRDQMPRDCGCRWVEQDGRWYNAHDLARVTRPTPPPEDT